MKSRSEQPTCVLRWWQTHDLDNLSRMRLQQQWIVTEHESTDNSMSRTTEWRDVQVVDGGLEP